MLFEGHLRSLRCALMAYVVVSYEPQPLQPYVADIGSRYQET